MSSFHVLVRFQPRDFCTQMRASLLSLPALTGYLLARFAQSSTSRHSWIAGFAQKIAVALDALSELNLAIFYFRGTYQDLVKRIFSVRHVRTCLSFPVIKLQADLNHVKVSGTAPNPNFRPPSYSFLGFLLILRLSYRFIQAVRSFRVRKSVEGQRLSGSVKGKQASQSSQSSQGPTIDGLSVSTILAEMPDESAPHIPAEEDEHTVMSFAVVPEDMRARRNCTLCLEERTATCATECGHLFCWSCIQSWGREKVRSA